MLPDDLCRDSVKVNKLSHLVRIPRRDQHLVVSFPKFFDDWAEERDVWRIV